MKGSEAKNSPLASVAATRAVLDEFGLSTKKSFGQHFLINDAIVGKILELAGVQPGEHILEVGPGIGTLSVALLQAGAQVFAVERDTSLLPVLAKTCEPWGDAFHVVAKDALDLAEEDFAASTMPHKFVANLPYEVAATLVLDIFERFETIESATVMVQAEVADRMMARPGTKDYGAYTVKLGLYAQPASRFKVGPGNFFPPPRVDSAVIRLDRTALQGVSPDERRAAATMADAAFANRRKTILNSCKVFFADKPALCAALPDVFQQCGIDPACRGETLALADFLALGKAAGAVVHM